MLGFDVLIIIVLRGVYMNIEELRTKEEVINYFLNKGINITDEQLEDLKKKYNNKTQKNQKQLSLQQLDNIAGGWPGFYYRGEHTCMELGFQRINHPKCGSITQLKAPYCRLEQNIGLLLNIDRAEDSNVYGTVISVFNLSSLKNHIFSRNIKFAHQDAGYIGSFNAQFDSAYERYKDTYSRTEHSLTPPHIEAITLILTREISEALKNETSDNILCILHDTLYRYNECHSRYISDSEKQYVDFNRYGDSIVGDAVRLNRTIIEDFFKDPNFRDSSAYLISAAIMGKVQYILGVDSDRETITDPEIIANAFIDTTKMAKRIFSAPVMTSYPKIEIDPRTIIDKSLQLVNLYENYGMLDKTTVENIISGIRMIEIEKLERDLSNVGYVSFPLAIFNLDSNYSHCAFIPTRPFIQRLPNTDSSSLSGTRFNSPSSSSAYEVPGKITGRWEDYNDYPTSTSGSDHVVAVTSSGRNTFDRHSSDVYSSSLVPASTRDARFDSTSSRFEPRSTRRARFDRSLFLPTDFMARLKGLYDIDSILMRIPSLTPEYIDYAERGFANIYGPGFNCSYKDLSEKLSTLGITIVRIEKNPFYKPIGTKADPDYSRYKYNVFVDYSEFFKNLFGDEIASKLGDCSCVKFYKNPFFRSLHNLASSPDCSRIIDEARSNISVMGCDDPIYDSAKNWILADGDSKVDIEVCSEYAIDLIFDKYQGINTDEIACHAFLDPKKPLSDLFCKNGGQLKSLMEAFITLVFTCTGKKMIEKYYEVKDHEDKAVNMGEHYIFNGKDKGNPCEEKPMTIIGCAAADLSNDPAILSDKISKEDVERFITEYEHRWLNILKLCISNKKFTLVTGLFGCGKFKNNYEWCIKGLVRALNTLSGVADDNSGIELPYRSLMKKIYITGVKGPEGRKIPHIYELLNEKTSSVQPVDNPTFSFCTVAPGHPPFSSGSRGDTQGFSVSKVTSGTRFDRNTSSSLSGTRFDTSNPSSLSIATNPESERVSKALSGFIERSGSTSLPEIPQILIRETYRFTPYVRRINIYLKALESMFRVENTCFCEQASLIDAAISLTKCLMPQKEPHPKPIYLNYIKFLKEICGPETITYLKSVIGLEKFEKVSLYVENKDNTITLNIDPYFESLYKLLKSSVNPIKEINEPLSCIKFFDDTHAIEINLDYSKKPFREGSIDQCTDFANAFISKIDERVIQNYACHIFLDPLNNLGMLFRTQGSQMESLIRDFPALLFTCLSEEMTQNYFGLPIPEGQLGKRRAVFMGPSLGMINERGIGKRMNFIGCAAANLFETEINPKSKEVIEEYKYRWLNIFKACIKQQKTDLITGLFGCGAFGNDRNSCIEGLIRALNEETGLVDEYNRPIRYWQIIRVHLTGIREEVDYATIVKSRLVLSDPKPTSMLNQRDTQFPQQVRGVPSSFSSSFVPVFESAPKLDQNVESIFNKLSRLRSRSITNDFELISNMSDLGLVKFNCSYVYSVEYNRYYLSGEIARGFSLEEIKCCDSSSRYLYCFLDYDNIFKNLFGITKCDYFKTHEFSNSSKAGIALTISRNEIMGDSFYMHPLFRRLYFLVKDEEFLQEAKASATQTSTCHAETKFSHEEEGFIRSRSRSYIDAKISATKAYMTPEMDAFYAKHKTEIDAGTIKIGFTIFGDCFELGGFPFINGVISQEEIMETDFSAALIALFSEDGQAYYELALKDKASPTKDLFGNQSAVLIPALRQFNDNGHSDLIASAILCSAPDRDGRTNGKYPSIDGKTIEEIVGTLNDFKAYGKSEPEVLSEPYIMFMAFYERWLNIFKAAIKSKTTDLFTGMFGCGVFGNDPRIVMSACIAALRTSTGVDNIPYYKCFNLHFTGINSNPQYPKPYEEEICQLVSENLRDLPEVIEPLNDLEDTERYERINSLFQIFNQVIVTDPRDWTLRREPLILSEYQEFLDKHHVSDHPETHQFGYQSLNYSSTSDIDSRQFSSSLTAPQNTVKSQSTSAQSTSSLFVPTYPSAPPDSFTLWSGCPSLSSSSSPTVAPRTKSHIADTVEPDIYQQCFATYLATNGIKQAIEKFKIYEENIDSIQFPKFTFEVQQDYSRRLTKISSIFFSNSPSIMNEFVQTMKSCVWFIADFKNGIDKGLAILMHNCFWNIANHLERRHPAEDLPQHVIDNMKLFVALMHYTCRLSKSETTRAFCDSWKEIAGYLDLDLHEPQSRYNDDDDDEF